MVFVDTIAEKPLFVPGTALAQVDCRENALVGHFAIQHDLGVARAFELLENDLVHATARLDERRRYDRERSAPFDVARGTKDAAWNLHRAGVNTAGHGTAGSPAVQVERSTEPRQGIQ